MNSTCRYGLNASALFVAEFSALKAAEAAARAGLDEPPPGYGQKDTIRVDVRENRPGLSDLKAKDGRDFDVAYDQIQLKGHQDAVALFDAYSKGGDNPDLKK
jgi:uncharacterized protein DUF4142